MGTPFSYCNKPGLEPNADSCKKLEPSSKVDKDKAKSVAADYIKKDPTRNCCTIIEDKLVTQWQLKENKTEVELQKANSVGTTFYYHNKLKIKK